MSYFRLFAKCSTIPIAIGRANSAWIPEPDNYRVCSGQI